VAVICHHRMARPRIANGGGGGLQMWRVAANILNKHLRTADKRWYSRLGFGLGAKTSHRKKYLVTIRYTGHRNLRAVVNTVMNLRVT
jgi:hypothetical protein